MRRADRLFQIVQFLRGGRLTTAHKLAQKLEVSERTIYRDIVDLQSSGVPIDGEAGVGYVMRAGYDLPPLMFTRDEIVAIVTGIKLARAWAGLDIAAAADEALIKIEAVLPDREREKLHRTSVHAFAIGLGIRERKLFDRIERATEARHILTLSYRNASGEISERNVRPLGLWYWGKVWTLGGWCELRDAFRNFRVDRITKLEISGQTFRPEPGKNLTDFYRDQRDSY